ncbi:class I SAM-dependent methyltransferase [Azospirillum agricola]|uniref:class I SAM-dependent methyltransferase n=1 Tax=Azospirillum agricola TaxID=1720247 RepID=UPI000A0EEFC2|nr:class I SAM-dependent methyltransferase [Azospirillum agricola]SMH41563.1 hypothetical protein SAMN02982994_1741 [Azospirillum lipoferum]
MTGTAPVCAEDLLRRFEAYDPYGSSPISSFWPPRVRPRRWNGDRRDATADAIHYDRAETAALINLLAGRGRPRRRVLISDFYSGLSCRLWGELFETVEAISLRPFPEPVLQDGRFRIHFGLIGDLPFLYRALSDMRPLDVVIIDGTVRYDLVMTLYYTVRRIVADGGLIVFLHTCVTEPGNHTRRFVEGLRQGSIDGLSHTINDLAFAGTGGLGVAFEEIGR